MVDRCITKHKKEKFFFFVFVFVYLFFLFDRQKSVLHYSPLFRHFHRDVRRRRRRSTILYIIHV
jgi:hypothetical protein